MSRNIDSKIWGDDWFGELEPYGKLIWLGVIHGVADDQGRLVYNPEYIKSQIFPYSSTIGAYEVGIWLSIFIADGKLHEYEAKGKSLLQIVNWWKYQNGAAWMSASRYPAPDGWMDRMRYHGKQNAIISQNWDKEGGFCELPSQLPSELPSRLGSNDFNINVNGDDEVKGDSDNDIIPVSFPGNTLADGCALITESAKLSALPPSEAEKRAAQVQALVATHGKRKTADALRQAVEAWTSTKSAQTGRKYSKLNLAWIDWAQGLLDNGETPWAAPSEPEPAYNTYVPEEPREVVTFDEYLRRKQARGEKLTPREMSALQAAANV